MWVCKTIFGGWSCLFGILLWTVCLNNRPILGKDPVDLGNIERGSEARKLLEEGIVLYDQQSFTKSKNLWLKSRSLYAQQGDILGEALTWNNIALAHQQLGEWDLSNRAIDRSFSLLQDRGALSRLPGYWEILAKIENTQGNYQLHRGKAELALKNWQQAYSYYRRTNNQSGVILTQINQAKALQSLGFTVKALDILESLQESLKQSDVQLQAKGLRLLGTGLRNLGNLDRSAFVLQQSIALATAKPDVALSWLELGNTQRKQGNRALEIGKKDQAQDYFEQAIESYQEAQESDFLFLKARLNQLSLLVDLGQNREAEALVASGQFTPQFQPSRNSIYALLNYSRSLTCLRLSIENVPVCKTKSDLSKALDRESASAQEIIANINKAIAQARQIQDPLAEAQAISQLAEVYEIQRNYQQVQSLNQQALLLLEGKFVPDFTYRLEWQLGRIYKDKGDLKAARAIYRSAIASLEKVRANILFIDPQAQFSFRDRIEPVYREYVDLLLDTQDNQIPGENDLREAIKTIDALQLAELENFLGCDLSQLIALDETSIDKSAVQIYPILLQDRLVTIVEIPGKPLIFKEVKVGRTRVEQAVFALQANLTQSGKTPEVLAYGQEIYRWLIEPLESVLAKHPELKTLVFIPDSIIRNVPFNVLYDGEEYLLEKDYATVVSPRLKLFAPAPSRSPLKVLTGGVDIPQTIEGFDFGAIAQVKQELSQIAARVKTNAPLLNEAFTQAKIEQELQKGGFSAIHWKTHGVFSSDPIATFLVTYQNSIKAGELQSLIQTASRRKQKPLELLVLSACEAARGDDRAILGLAGLTVRTGARTALSTLWRADDRATTLLMTEFYLQLNLGKTKAEALRQAQLKLLRQEGYFAPFYWGTYLLVGNWL